MCYVYEDNVKNMEEFFGIVEGEKGKLYTILKEFLYEEKKTIEDIIKENGKKGKELEDILKGNSSIYKELDSSVRGEKNVFEHCKKLKVIECIKRIINNGYFSNGTEIGEKIYKDPDYYDKKLYQNIEVQYKNLDLKYKLVNRRNRLIKEYENKKIIFFSLDCVIGWKSILDTYYEEKKFIGNEKEFIKTYEIIRNPENAGHLLWPVHITPTINTERYHKFNDRVDYTLYDIKNYLDSKPEKDKFKLKSAYFTITSLWIDMFKNFDDFIEKMKLKRWCIEENGHYEVIDLSSENMTDKIDKYLCDKEIYDAKKEYPITELYIKNLIKKVEGK